MCNPCASVEFPGPSTYLFAPGIKDPVKKGTVRGSHYQEYVSIHGGDRNGRRGNNLEHCCR